MGHAEKPGGLCFAESLIKTNLAQAYHGGMRGSWYEESYF